MELLIGALVGAGTTVLVVGLVVLVRRPTPSPERVVEGVEAEVVAENLRDLALTVLDLAVRTPDLTAGERLTVVDDLRTHDLLDAEEHARARARILDEPT